MATPASVARSSSAAWGMPPMPQHQHHGHSKRRPNNRTSHQEERRLPSQTFLGPFNPSSIPATIFPVLERCDLILAGCRNGKTDPLNELGTSLTLPRGVAYSMVVRLRAAAKKVAAVTLPVRHRVAAAANSNDNSSMEEQTTAALFSGLDTPMEGLSARPPLAVCCQEGLVEITALLLLAGADPNVQVKATGETPLFLACERGNAECAALLIMVRLTPAPGHMSSLEHHPPCTDPHCACKLIHLFAH